nr:hypothetical protein [Tanacetum cinerariifolium]
TATIRTVDNEEQEITATVDGKEFTVTEASASLNKVTELPQTIEPIPNVANEAINEEREDRVERAATTASSLNAEQASGHTHGSREDSIELIKKLMETCNKLSERVLALEESNTTQDFVITRLKLRVEKLGRFDDETNFDAGFYEVQVTPTQVSAYGEARNQEDQPVDQLGVLSAAKVV